MTPLRRRILDYTLAGLLLLVPVALLHAQLADPHDLGGFDEAVLRISSPLESAVSWVIEGVGGLVTHYVWLVDVREENRALRRENRHLRTELAGALRRSADTQSLEDLVRLRRRTPAETIGARVIGASMNPRFRVDRIRLDRGDKELAAGMPVISARGVVGRVQYVYGDYSDVLLATDPKSYIDVLIPRTGGRGELTGLGRPDSYACKIEYLERGKAVKVGDLVVTSGVGSAFPAGVVVGHIQRVVRKQYGLYQKVEVKPSVDFSSLERVVVLLAPPPPPDPNAGTRRPTPADRVRAF